jgi:hypothetical protein
MGMVIIVDGERVQVFEYEDVARSKREFEGLTGIGPGLVFFEEGEPPLVEVVRPGRNCYRSGRFVLLYDGENDDVLQKLRTVVGKPSLLRQ